MLRATGHVISNKVLSGERPGEGNRCSVTGGRKLFAYLKEARPQGVQRQV